MWKRYISVPFALRVAIVMLVVLIVAAVSAPLWVCMGDCLVPFGPHEPSLLPLSYAPPMTVDGDGEIHLLGTDGVSRDVLARMIYGLRTSLIIGFITCAVALCIAVVLGVLSGYWGNRRGQMNIAQVLGGMALLSLTVFYAMHYQSFAIVAIGMAMAAFWVFILGHFPLRTFAIPIDHMVMRCTEVVSTIPALFLVMVLYAVWGNGSAWGLGIILGLIAWPSKMRILRAEVGAIRDSPYMVAARKSQVPFGRLCRRYIFPNTMSPLWVAMAFTFVAAIVVEASLTFLGVGLDDDVASLGQLLSESRQYFGAWWLAIFPGAVLFILILSLNVIANNIPKIASNYAQADNKKTGITVVS